MKQYKLINGNSATELLQFPDNHFDSVVTDPPYGINFLGKEWDKDTGEEEVYRQCFRVLKPGGHLLAFSAARTYHHLAMAVERSGFEIRDQIMWVYGSGFPKSQDIGKMIDKRGEDGDEWSGWGTQLKPAHEPIVMAQKPFPDAIYKNVQKHGVGAINVDACRVAYEEGDNNIEWMKKYKAEYEANSKRVGELWTDTESRTKENDTIRVKGGGQDIDISHHFQGRFPANFIHDGSDEVVKLFPDESQRFFYCAKVSKSERNIGCEDIKPEFKESANFRPNHMEKALNGEDGNPFGRYQPINNNHPTVKPVAIMKYLIQLVTPQGGKVLDPFNGSGSTGMAAVELEYDYTGIELDAKYVDIATKRIEAWWEKTHPQAFTNPLFTQETK
jgi:site-specific DNA-methyltransferase (adenine-specific)